MWPLDCARVTKGLFRIYLAPNTVAMLNVLLRKFDKSFLNLIKITMCKRKTYCNISNIIFLIMTSLKQRLLLSKLICRRFMWENISRRNRVKA